MVHGHCKQEIINPNLIDQQIKLTTRVFFPLHGLYQKIFFTALLNGWVTDARRFFINTAFHNGWVTSAVG
jgi:hypothetical protein